MTDLLMTSMAKTTALQLQGETKADSLFTFQQHFKAVNLEGSGSC